MKKLITILALIFVSNYGFSQVHFQLAKSEPMAALLKSDTLEILDIKQIKFIKIGENVYEIKSPTIEKVQPINNGIFIMPNNNNWIPEQDSIQTYIKTLLNQRDKLLLKN